MGELGWGRVGLWSRGKRRRGSFRVIQRGTRSQVVDIVEGGGLGRDRSKGLETGSETRVCASRFCRSYNGVSNMLSGCKN